MKSNHLFVLIISIIISLISLIEGKTVWIENKLDAGNVAFTAATTYLGHGDYNWKCGEGCIDQAKGISHHGFHLTIPDDKAITTYYLVFRVTEQDKWRGPFDNTQDICWHFHGHLDSWKVYPCGSQ